MRVAYASTFVKLEPQFITYFTSNIYYHNDNILTKLSKMLVAVTFSITILFYSTFIPRRGTI